MFPAVAKPGVTLLIAVLAFAIKYESAPLKVVIEPLRQILMCDTDQLLLQ